MLKPCPELKASGTGEHHCGLFAARNFAAGDAICPYWGDVIHDDRESPYRLRNEDGLLCDSSCQRWWGAMVNHSQTPNAIFSWIPPIPRDMLVSPDPEDAEGRVTLSGAVNSPDITTYPAIALLRPALRRAFRVHDGGCFWVVAQQPIARGEELRVDYGEEYHDAAVFEDEIVSVHPPLC